MSQLTLPIEFPPASLFPWPRSRMPDKPKFSPDQITEALKRLPQRFRRKWELLVNESLRPGISRVITESHCLEMIQAEHRREVAKKEAKASPGLFGEIVAAKKGKRSKTLPDLA